MAKVCVLGAGMVGREVARDLSARHQVLLADRDPQSLQLMESVQGITTKSADLSDKINVTAAITDADIVVGALPGFLGYECLKTVLESGKNCVDIAFFPEDALLLDSLAKAKNVTAIVDCGVAPGMSNLFAGYHKKRMKKIERFDCMVGGLPRLRKWPFEYKAPFSPIDVIEEYTRPAVYIENGTTCIRPALSDTELIDFPNIGTLEAFLTDGLRSLAKTIQAPYMRERTLRYPGHARFMQALRDVGFFSKEPINIAGTKISPLEFTSKIMFPHWKLGKDEEEFTVMRVEIEGVSQSGQHEKHRYDLFDQFDLKNKVSSMARTTGYTCTAAVELLLSGYSRPGVNPPEYVGEDQAAFDHILGYLAERNVTYKYTMS